MNKIILFSFVFLLFPMSNSFGAYQTNLGDDMFIFVQSTVRNSDGVLVLYLESSKVTDLNLPGMELFFDLEALPGVDPTITIDGQNYQVIKRVQSQSFDSDELVASTMLTDTINGKSTVLVRFPHDGFPVESGDTLEIRWTFVRPVS